MRKISVRTLFQWTFGIIFVLYVSLVFALNNLSVQHYLAKVVSSTLQERLHSKISIERIEPGLFNSIALHNTEIRDRKGAQLLQSKLIFVKIQILPLLRHKISLRNIALLDSHIYLYKTNSQSPVNFQYILDAFKSSNQSSPTSPDLRINSLIMRRCTLHYDEWDRPHPSKGKFSPYHVALSHIDANFTLKHFTSDSLNLRIRQFAARESCGWYLQKLNLNLEANRRQCIIRRLEIKTPLSLIAQNNITIKYHLKSAESFPTAIAAHAHIDDWQISLSDLAPMVPILGTIKERFQLSGDVYCLPSQIKAIRWKVVNDNRTFRLQTDATISLQNHQFKQISVQCRKLEAQQNFIRLLLHTFLKKIPIPIDRTGDLYLSGAGTYKTDNTGTFKGNLHTDFGELIADVAYADRELKGKISSPDLQPSRLIEKSYIPSLLDFALQGKVSFPVNGHPRGNINAVVHKMKLGNKTFGQLRLTADASTPQTKVEIESKQPELNFSAAISAFIDQKWHPSHLYLNLKVQRWIPEILGFAPPWGNGSLAFHLQSELASLDFKHPVGKLQLNHLTLSGDHTGQPPYSLERLTLTATPHPNGTHLNLHSDFADAAFTGIPDLSQIKTSIDHWITTVSPSTATHSLTPARHRPADYIAFAGTLKRTDFFRRFFNTDFRLSQPATIDGKLAVDGSAMRIIAFVPSLTWGEQTLNNITLAARSQGSKFDMLAKVRRPQRENEMQVELKVGAEEGKWKNILQWDELKRHRFSGTINTEGELQLPNTKRGLQFALDILPSYFNFNDSTWNVESGNLALKGRELKIHHAAVRHADQFISLYGSYARGGEGIAVDLKNVDVGILSTLTGLEVVRFDGKTTGRAIIKPDEHKRPRLTAFLDIPGFRFNNTPMGHARIKGDFETENQTIHLQATMTEGDIGQTNVSGYVSLGHHDLDLNITEENTPLGFLNHYIDGIFHNIQGRTSGTCRVFGGFKTIDFEGHQKATASALLPINGVNYRIKDAEIDISPGEFRLRRAALSDESRGTGEAKGTLRHHHLHNMHYDFAINGKNIQLYDRPQEDSMPFYAKAFGTGNVWLRGEPGRMEANIKMNADERSIFTYILDRPNSSDIQLLTFHDASPIDTPHIHTPHSVEPPVKEDENKTDIHLNLQLDIVPGATIRMITDNKNGDVITVHGNGSLQTTYYNKGDFQMYGTYNIASGTYDLSIQNLIKKTFTLHSGGTVVFSGDPLNADVNVMADYLVNSASLADLNVGNSFSNTTTPVNCLIHFTGRVGNMNLSLDFDLPNVSDDEKMMVRHLIASDEERTTQVLYLLSVGRFYTYNYASTTGAESQSQSSVMMQSLLAGTLSSQVSNIISNAVGSNNWSIGANVSTGRLGWSDMEFDGLLSGHLLNNRLLFNGKVGYRDQQTTTTNFVGDFDVNYLLNAAGTVSLKAYSETNSRYFSKSTLTTQGVGIRLKRDFDSLRDLFKRKKSSGTLPVSTPFNISTH